MRMECPMCGLELPIAILEYHAWECTGREEPDEGSLTGENAVPSAQVACTPDVQQAEEGEPASPSETSEVPHPDTERCQGKDAMPECPLCFRSIPADLIIEHSAFCNGPSCGKLPDQAILEFTERVSCDPSEPQEQEIGACAQPPGEVIPSRSQALGSSVFTEVTRSIMQVFHSFVGRNDAVGSREVTWSVEPKNGQEDSETSENMQKLLQYLAKVQKHLDNDPEFNNRKGAVVSRETTWSVEPKSGQEDNETSEDKEQLLQYLGEVQKRLDNDPELNQLLCPLLKVSRPLELLQCLIKSIFGKATGSNVTPFALFFYLAKMFLPRILEVESWTALLKWLDLIIPDVVVPWIARMGGWVKVRPPTMSHFASPLGLLLILALSTTSPMEARPAKHSHQDDHMQGLIPNPRLGQGHHQRRHAIPYVQINDDGQVSKSEHQNEYTLMDIQFTNTGIVIKGRKSARYLCSHTNSTLYSMPQLEENCTFKESTTSNQRRDDGHLEQRSSSQAKTGSACVQSEQINPNSPDPVEMIV
ncbi:uncharacterized protein [Hemitrygon akajei]|uniref:uncharacterized protein n=1 Tax=Hemitrygon akajei TaxID=2704970 RepID=UPI003BF99A41